MQLQTPRRVGWLWAVSVILAIAIVPLILYDGELYYAEGGTSPDGPGMLMVAVLVTSPIWVGAWLVITALYLIGYRGSARVANGIGETFAAMILSFAAFAISGLFLWCIVARVDVWKPSRLPFVAHLLGCAVYFQYLRAAAVHRSSSPRATGAGD